MKVETDLLAELADRFPEDFTVESRLILLIDISGVDDSQRDFTAGQCRGCEVEMNHFKFRQISDDCRTRSTTGDGGRSDVQILSMQHEKARRIDNIHLDRHFTVERNDRRIGQ